MIMSHNKTRTSWHSDRTTLKGTSFVSMAGWILTYTCLIGARGSRALEGIHLYYDCVVLI
jgi:hypothetical protein